jgi:hypothetical protein
MSRLFVIRTCAFVVNSRVFAVMSLAADTAPRSSYSSDRSAVSM